MAILSEVKDCICQENYDLALNVIDQLEGNDKTLGKLVKSKLLGDKGDFSLALQILNELESNAEESHEIKFGSVVSKMNVYWKQAKYEKLPELILEGKMQLQYLEDRESDFLLWFKGHFYNSTGNFYWDKGNLPQALENYITSLEIRNKLGATTEIADSINNLGNIHYNLGEYELALQKYEENLTLKRKIKPNADMSVSLANIGSVSMEMGHLNKAVSYFQQSIDSMYKSKSVDQSAIAYRYVDIAVIHTLKGNLDTALTYLNNAKSIYSELGNDYQLGRTLGALGNVWYYKNDLQEAEKYLELSLRLLNIFGNDFEKSISLYRMIQVKLAMKSISEASEFLNYLNNINKRMENDVVELRYLLAKAMLERNKPRLRSHVNAREVFSKILEDPLLTEIIKVEARIGICDLLIKEYELLSNDELYPEILNITDSIYKFGQVESAFPFIIIALSYRARMANTKEEYRHASELLKIAEYYADEYGLKLEKVKIQKTRNELHLPPYDSREAKSYNGYVQNKDEDQEILDYLSDLKKFKFHGD